ncbi:cytochrome P450 [Astrocystis sublimbata]|nr:cytochrome P450 [Astrocystis sublimbata]
MGYGLFLDILTYAVGALLASILANLLYQQLPRSKSEPPLVFHWIPFVGNAISYGVDPCRFYTQCREKYGDIFTFVLFGRDITVFLGIKGNEFILDGRLQDVNAEEIYSPLTTPVFGPNIIYDCPNSQLMEQKKFVKFGLTQTALESYVQLMEAEVVEYLKTAPAFQAQSGVADITTVMAEITIYTASRSLQGAEVRGKINAGFADLYHDLDSGFRPINFLLPWAPLPQNRRRDAARAKMHAVYREIINNRRSRGKGKQDDEAPDMIWNLMSCVYKNGAPLLDQEIADMMITLLMAGQHSSSSSSAWTMARLAANPLIAEQLFRERQAVCGAGKPLQNDDIEKLPLTQNVVKETLRVHSSIHSIMRKVKNPMAVPDRDYVREILHHCHLYEGSKLTKSFSCPQVITPGKVLLASPIVTHLSEEYFQNAQKWDPMRWARDSQQDTEDDDVVDYGYGLTAKATRSPYLPFGAGRHRCIGEKFAYTNLVTIISTMVQHLKLSTLDGSEEWVSSTDYTSLFSRPAQPTLIRWERRAAWKQ